MANRKPKVGEVFRMDGAKHTVTAVGPNKAGVEQVDMVPVKGADVPHDTISCAAAACVWNADWEYWTLPGREEKRPLRRVAAVTVEED